MALSDPRSPRLSQLPRFRHEARGSLVDREMLWFAWLPMLLIGVAHYATGAHHHWVHDVLRRLYYIPILYASFARGTRGGLAVAAVSSLSYAPHAFFVMPHAQDPAGTLNKVLEIVLYNVIGLVAGVLANREAARTRQAEQAFEEQQRMAAQLVRAGRLAALGELVAGVAHEIKNPLHTIKGTAEIVDEIVPRDREQHRMWIVLRAEIQRLEGIAERFLSFARPLKPDLQPQLLDEVYRRIAELLHAQTHGAPGCQLHIKPLPRALAERQILVDRDQLAQMLLGISSNALRATEGRGELRLSVSLREEGATNWLALRLENDGPAIPEEEIERIFDPFFTRSDEGTGLGLAIAARIAEGHGGFVEVANLGAEQGVAFVVVVPV